MIAELYANMCGVELWNRARVARYMSNGVKPPRVSLVCDPCAGLEDLIPCIEDQAPQQTPPIADGYQLPELDGAPWYDPAAPESKDFAGMLVLETSLSAVVDRRMVQNIGHGATLTRVRFEGRTLTVRGLLVGRTCCASSYGFKWLTQALLGDFCDACDGCLLSFLTCSPTDVSDCLMVFEDDGGHVPYFRAPEATEWGRGTDFVRQMYGAGLLQGPTAVATRSGGSCGCGCGALTEVEFTIGVGNPWLYRIEELVVGDALLGGCETETCRIVFDDSSTCDPLDPCAVVDDCDVDPDSPTVPTAPPAGLLPTSQSGCLALVVGRNCVSVPADREWFDQALIIEISAGSAPLRNLTLHAWQNPIGLECCGVDNQDYFSDCNACATLLVGYVPAFGVLRFDSAAREVTITCNNLTRPAAKNLATVVGLPFEWFEVGCQPVCLGIDVDCVNISGDAAVTVYRVGREL